MFHISTSPRRINRVITSFAAGVPRSRAIERLLRFKCTAFEDIASVRPRPARCRTISPVSGSIFTTSAP
jgi:hypothetical protein